jgi:hypothetical protein
MVDVRKLVERMGEFAATTKDDRLSVAVSRVANRLAHAGAAFERRLTPGELAVIRPFLRNQ